MLCRAVERAAEQIDVPFTVGGGVRRVGRVRELLLAGADKVSLNAPPWRRPGLIEGGSRALRIAVHRGARSTRGASPTAAGAHTSTAGASPTELGSDRLGQPRGRARRRRDPDDVDGLRRRAGRLRPRARARRSCEAVNVPVVASGGAGKPGAPRGRARGRRRGGARGVDLPRRNPHGRGDEGGLPRARAAHAMNVDPATLSYDGDGLVACICQDAGHGRRPDVRLGQSRGASSARSRPGAPGSGAVRAASSGRRARPAATSSQSSSVSADCDGERCSIASSRAGPPATRAARRAGARPRTLPGRARAHDRGAAATPIRRSYVARLLHGPREHAARKVGEEATEVLLAVPGSGRADRRGGRPRLPCARARGARRPGSARGLRRARAPPRRRSGGGG